MAFDNAPGCSPPATTPCFVAGGAASTRVMENLGLVQQEARRLARRLPRHIQMGELLGAGCVGLLSAADRFDASRGNAFGVFARLKIRAAMLDELRELDVLPRRARASLKHLERTRRALAGQHGREPSRGELAVATGLDPHTVDNLLAMEETAAGGALHAAGPQGPPSADALAEHNECVEHLGAAMLSLGERHQRVLQAYYWDNLTFREIGHRWGVTESRVCQIHGEAVRSLRRCL